MKQSADLWPIFVISLEDAVDRRKQIASQLQAAGLSFSFINAIDGRKKLPPVWEASIDRQGAFEDNGYAMSDGEFACALSHQLAYARVLEDDLPGAVVLEDDAILTPNFAMFYGQGLYRQADFMQLFCFAARIWRGPGRRVLGHVRLHRLERSPFSTVGYTVSHRAATALTAAAKPLRGRADWPLDVSKLGGMLTVPSVILHPPPELAPSDLNEGRSGLIPADFDYSAKFEKGWRRLIAPAAWKRFIRKRLSREITPGFPEISDIHIDE